MGTRRPLVTKEAPPKIPPTRRSEGKWGGRMYEIPPSEGYPSTEFYPSVTNILGIVGKPALVNWAAKVERELVVKTAADLYTQTPAGTPKMNRAGYERTLLDWIGRQKAKDRELERASNIGSQTHALIEWTIRKEMGQKVGAEPVMSDEALWAFMAWDDWRQRNRFRAKFMEQAVWSRKHRYAGTLDLAAEIAWEEEGKNALWVPTIVDWKTGKAIYKEAKMQVASYGMGLIEMGHAEPPLEGAILRLPKNQTDPNFEVCRLTWDEMQHHFEGFLHAKGLHDWSQEEEAKREGGKAA